LTHFKYRGTSPSGSPIAGTIDAVDRYDAVNRLRQTCAVVTDLGEVSSKDVDDIFGSQKVKLKPLSLMCNQFAIILGAGLPLVRCVELIADQMADRTLRKILKDVAADVAAGSSLSASFEDRGKNLPPTFIESIRAGEQSGNLDEAFARLSRYYVKANKNKQKMASALVYPCFVLAVAVVVIAVIMIFAIPSISASFTASGNELPVLTKIMIGASNFMAHNWLYILCAILAIVIGLKIYGHTDQGRFSLARNALKVPVFGKINTLSNCAQFSNTMSAMVASGIPVVKAVGVAGRAMSNYCMSLGIQQAAPGLEAGRRLADCLRKNEYLPPLLVEMTAVGEETGELEHTLEVVSEYYDNETDVASARALSLLEPILIVILGVFVLLVLLSVYLPMFGMYNNVGAG
jgi:type IV pilus assembly protein PilC